MQDMEESLRKVQLEQFLLVHLVWLSLQELLLEIMQIYQLLTVVLTSQGVRLQLRMQLHLLTETLLFLLVHLLHRLERLVLQRVREVRITQH